MRLKIIQCLCSAQWQLKWDDFEAVPGREEYDLGEDGSAEWAKDMLEFADDNFNDAGNEVKDPSPGPGP